MIADTGTCTDGSVRLVGGIIQQEGRIEVCFNGVWGSVCPNYWNPIDAYVVCAQLGYTGASKRFMNTFIHQAITGSRVLILFTLC